MNEELEKNITNAIFYKDCYNYLVRINEAKNKVEEYKKILKDKKRLIEFNEIIYNPILVYLSTVSLELKFKSLIKEKDLTKTKTHNIQHLFLKIEKSIQIKIYESVKNKYKKLDIEKCNEKYLKCEYFSKLSEIKHYQLEENFSFEDFLNYLNSNFPKKLFSKGRSGDFHRILLIESNILNSILFFEKPLDKNHNNKFLSYDFMPFYMSFEILKSILNGYEIPEIEILTLNNLDIFHVINSLYYYSLELTFISILKLNGIKEYSKQPHNIRELFNLIPIDIKNDIFHYLIEKTNSNNLILSEDIIFEFENLIKNNFSFLNYYIKIIINKRIELIYRLYDFCKGKNIEDAFYELILHENDPYVQYRYINENIFNVEKYLHFPDVQFAFLNYLLEYIKEKHNLDFLNNHKL